MISRKHDFNWGQFGIDLATVAMQGFAIKGGVDGLKYAEEVSFCFVAGTLVATEDGHKPIEVGDKVLSANPETGEIAYKTVEETYINETDEFIHVHVNGETISATPNHPFYVDKFGWILAKNLRAGDILVLSNGEFVVVEWVQHEILENPINVYNFEVQDFHSYFVGESAILVHNECVEYSDWDSFRTANKGKIGEGGITVFLRREKPKHSPTVKDWLNAGRTIEINDGVWKYKMEKSFQELTQKRDMSLFLVTAIIQTMIHCQ